MTSKTIGCRGLAYFQTHPPPLGGQNVRLVFNLCCHCEAIPFSRHGWQVIRHSATNFWYIHTWCMCMSKFKIILTRFENTPVQCHLITWIFSHFPDVLHPMLGNRFQTSPRRPKCQIGFQSLLPLRSYSIFKAWMASHPAFRNKHLVHTYVVHVHVKVQNHSNQV